MMNYHPFLFYAAFLELYMHPASRPDAQIKIKFLKVNVFESTNNL